MIDNRFDATGGTNRPGPKTMLEFLVAEWHCLNQRLLLKQNSFPGSDAWFRLALVRTGRTAQAYAQ